MQPRRTFSKSFKVKVVEELINKISRPAQICRNYNITDKLLYAWKQEYENGHLYDDTTDELTLKAENERLKLLVGDLSLQNDMLKKTISYQKSITKIKKSLSD